MTFPKNCHISCVIKCCFSSSVKGFRSSAPLIEPYIRLHSCGVITCIIYSSINGTDDLNPCYSHVEESRYKTAKTMQQKN